MASSYTLSIYGAKRSAEGCNGMVVQLLVQLIVQLHPIHQPSYGPVYRITSGACYYCHLGRKIEIAWALRYLKHIFRSTLLVPSREENISSLGAAVQHNFRRTLLVPSREENIKRISIAWTSRYSQAKIP